MPYNLTHGSRVGVFVDGRKFGNVISIDLSIQTPSREIVEIDNLVPVELAPTMARVSGGVRLYRIVGSGGLEGAGITTTFDTIPQQKYCRITIKDLPTDTVLYQFDYCKVQSQSYSFATKELSIGTFSFKGISYGTEISG